MLKFTQDHEWLLVDGDAATIGITQHAQEQRERSSKSIKRWSTSLAW